MSREFVKAMQARCEVDSTDLEAVLSWSKQCVFVQDLSKDCTIDPPERIDGGEDSRDSVDKVTAKEALTSGIRGDYQEVQRVCKDSGEGVLTTVVYFINLARECVETRCKNAELLERYMDVKANFLERAPQKVQCAASLKVRCVSSQL